MKHSKYYYDYTRNCGCTECTCEKKRIGKPIFTHEEMESIFALPDDKKQTIPDYYKGSNGYEASKVVEGFQPENYNISTALTYLMRAGKKIYVNNSAKESMIKDIEKAIHHLQFELERNGNS